jgi:RND superfamily putative drug exporter
MMGVATAVVVAVAMVAAVTLLPALLGLVKMRVLSRRTRRTKPAVVAPEATLTGRWAAHASKHPWRYGIASFIVLITLAAPVVAMNLGQSDAGSEPTSSTARRAYDLVTTSFGTGANGPLVVTVDLDRTSADGLADRIAAVPGVAAVAPAVFNAAHDAAVITVTPTTGPQDVKTEALVSRLRSDILPAGASVTGATAAFMDFNQRLQDRLPLVIAVVVGSSFLLLVLVFRSIIAPLKAAVMNLLSIGAAYGAVVALFQWGWGTSFLGLERAVPVSAFVPMFMFAILFGLSMDYEVFLLGRVREEWDRTGDARGSVVSALSSTGRVITSAALIMTAVFAGFAMDGVVAIKMMGVGMAVAIFVDATLVRLVLVPATMVLLGRWNWWLPRSLDRILPGSIHAPHLPVPERSPEPALV